MNSNTPKSIISVPLNIPVLVFDASGYYVHGVKGWRTTVISDLFPIPPTLTHWMPVPGNPNQPQEDLQFEELTFFRTAFPRAKQNWEAMLRNKEELSKTSPLMQLLCCCCDSYTTGRQWYNRDAGYGLCWKCASKIQAKETLEQMISFYGKVGYHYFLTEDAV
jgi:hypothetical protein